jgi:hypothetical protein
MLWRMHGGTWIEEKQTLHIATSKSGGSKLLEPSSREDFRFTSFLSICIPPSSDVAIACIPLPYPSLGHEVIRGHTGLQQTKYRHHLHGLGHS